MLKTDSAFFIFSLLISVFCCDWHDSIWSITNRRIARATASQSPWMPSTISVVESRQACDVVSAVQTTYEEGRWKTFPTAKCLTFTYFTIKAARYAENNSFQAWSDTSALGR